MAAPPPMAMSISMKQRVIKSHRYYLTIRSTSVSTSICKVRTYQLNYLILVDRKL